MRRPQWAHLLLERLAGLACRNAAVLVASGIDVLALDDDVGMPGTMMISPQTWRTFLKPRYARVIAAARDVCPDLRILFHSDGDFTPIIADLIEIGVAAIHPLQPEHMDAVAIRRAYGRRVALWGTVGRPSTFARGTPEELRREVGSLSRRWDSALVLWPADDIDEPDVPWENIAAFLEAVAACG